MKEEDKEFQKHLDKAKELEELTISPEDDFDFEEYFKAVGEIAHKNKAHKNEEANEVLNEFAGKYLSEESIKSIDNKKDSIQNLLRKFDPNSDLIKEMNIYDVDKIYALSNYLVNAYINYLNEIYFKIVLTPGEIKFLDRILTKTIEYNSEDVFNYIKLYEEFWVDAMKIYNDDKSKSEYSFDMKIQMILILHHLIKEFKVKGSGNDYRYFRSILYQIAETNKLFNAYNIIVERIKEDCKLWGSALDEVLKPKDPEENKELKIVQASDLEPKKEETE